MASVHNGNKELWDVSDADQADRIRRTLAHVNGLDEGRQNHLLSARFGHLFNPMGFDVWALNPYAAKRWARLLHDAVVSADIKGTPRTVTIVNNDWELALPTTPEAFRKAIKAMRRKIGVALRPYPFLVQIDIGFRRYTDEHRYVLSPHVHGVIWAPRRTIRDLKAKFGVTDHGVARFHSKEINDLAGWLAYCAKDPRVAYSVWGRQRTRPGCKPRSAKTFSEKQSRKQRAILLELVGDMRKFDLIIASGAAKAILGKARKVAKAKATPYRPSQPKPRKLTAKPRSR